MRHEIMMTLQGERYRALRDVEVLGMISFRSPSSSGFIAVFPMDEVVIVKSEPTKESPVFNVVPARYEEFEVEFVPELERLAPDYHSYALIIPFSVFYREFERVPPPVPTFH